MGPGGRGEACKLTPSRETRLGGDAAAETFSSRRTPGGDSRLAAGMARRGVAGCRLEEARHTPEKTSPRPLQTSMRQGGAGPRGRWRARSGGFRAALKGLVACDRPSQDRGWGSVCAEWGCARGCVCLCAHAARVERVLLPLTKPQ